MGISQLVSYPDSHPDIQSNNVDIVKFLEKAEIGTLTQLLEELQGKFKKCSLSGEYSIVKDCLDLVLNFKKQGIESDSILDLCRNTIGVALSYNQMRAANGNSHNVQLEVQDFIKKILWEPERYVHTSYRAASAETSLQN